MRCRAEPRRKGIPARRDLVGYRHPRGVRPGRRQPAHVYRPGNGDVLERLRRQHADARQRYVLRSARRRQEKFPVAVKNKLGNTRPRAKHNTSAKLAALHFYQLALPAPKAPEDTYDKQRAACGVRRRGVRRQSGLRALPRATALYRAGLVDAHGEGDRHRRLPGKAVASSCLRRLALETSIPPNFDFQPCATGASYTPSRAGSLPVMPWVAEEETERASYDLSL